MLLIIIMKIRNCILYYNTVKYEKQEYCTTPCLYSSGTVFPVFLHTTVIRSLSSIQKAAVKCFSDQARLMIDVYVCSKTCNYEIGFLYTLTFDIVRQSRCGWLLGTMRKKTISSAAALLFCFKMFVCVCVCLIKCLICYFFSITELLLLGSVTSPVPRTRSFSCAWSWPPQSNRFAFVLSCSMSCLFRFQQYIGYLCTLSSLCEMSGFRV